MFGFTPHETFIAGLAALWIFSAAVSSLPPPTGASGVFYTWAYKFLKIIAGDLGTSFGKYIPPAAAIMLAISCLLTLSPTACKQQAPPAWAATAPALTVPGELIAGANYAVMGYEKDAAAGMAYTQDATLKAVMSDIQKALTLAQPAFNSWEAALKANPAASEPAALPAALTQIQNDIAKLPAQLQKGK